MTPQNKDPHHDRGIPEGSPIAQFDCCEADLLVKLAGFGATMVSDAMDSSLPCSMRSSRFGCNSTRVKS
jgi:hypothetical protein